MLPLRTCTEREEGRLQLWRILPLRRCSPLERWKGYDTILLSFQSIKTQSLMGYMSLQTNASTCNSCCSCCQRDQEPSHHSSSSLWHRAQRHEHPKTHSVMISFSVIPKGSCSQKTWGKGMFEGKLLLVNKSEPGFVTGFSRYWRLWDIPWGELQTESGTSWERDRVRVRERKREMGWRWQVSELRCSII